jgi:hypothetical protein
MRSGRLWFRASAWKEVSKQPMKRALFLVLLINCVPDGAPVEPRGAIGVTTEPSPASRGEPFTTKDGFTVTIKRVIVFAMVHSVPPNLGDGPANGEVAERLFLFNASNPRRAEEKLLILRAVPVGNQALRFNLQGRGRFIIEGADKSFYLNVDVDKATEDRFRQPPEGLEDIATAEPDGPPMQTGMLLTAHLEKAETKIDLDLTLLGQGERNTQQIVNVTANTINQAFWTVTAERFFTEGGQDIANADTNHDGRVTGQELRAAIVVNPDTEEEDTVLNRLSAHTGEIVVPR